MSTSVSALGGFSLTKAISLRKEKKTLAEKLCVLSQLILSCFLKSGISEGVQLGVFQMFLSVTSGLCLHASVIDSHADALLL